MTEAQEQFRAFKATLGGFVNARPRDFDTPELTNGSIDRVVKALDAIRPTVASAPAETEKPDAPELGLETSEDATDKKRKRKQSDPNRMHTGGLDRNG